MAIAGKRTRLSVNVTVGFEVRIKTRSLMIVAFPAMTVKIPSKS